MKVYQLLDKLISFANIQIFRGDKMVLSFLASDFRNNRLLSHEFNSEVESWVVATECTIIITVK